MNNNTLHGTPLGTPLGIPPVTPPGTPHRTPPRTPPGTPHRTPPRTPPLLKNRRPNSKTNFNNNFFQSNEKFNNLPNNSNSVGKSLIELLTPNGKLNLYRAGSIGKIYDIGISFYGTSRRALQSYNKSKTKKKKYFRMVLSTTDTSKIVDLHLPIKINKIVEFLLSESTTKDEINILLSTLFVKYKSLEELLAKYRSDKFELVRHSEDVKEDIEMAKILMKIFPNSIGSYTRAGPFHSHNEIIIWNKAINEKLQKVKKTRKANNNNKKYSNKRARPF